MAVGALAVVVGAVVGPGVVVVAGAVVVAVVAEGVLICVVSEGPKLELSALVETGSNGEFKRESLVAIPDPQLVPSEIANMISGS